MIAREKVMRRVTVALLMGVVLHCSVVSGASAQDGFVAEGPVMYVYAVHDTVSLVAHVFSPSNPGDGPTGAVVVFHGGGWSIGDATWAFPTARHFATRGMVGVAVQYRLSDRGAVTPLEAMADARDVIRWMRVNADTLGIEPERIAAYGWSAGAHLATCAAIFDDGHSDSIVSSSPNALVLRSPGVSVTHDAWFQRLLGDRADARDMSPDEHVRAGLPPTLIVQGDVDTVTPLAGVSRFCDLMRAAGNVCELHVYEGYGHLFTPAGIPDNEMPQPDPGVSAEATARADDFLRSLGFMR